MIVGGGFAGMLTAIDLGKHGITDVRIVEKAGDFGGTWYWNRYPGCMCDVESYVVPPAPRGDRLHADRALRQRHGDLRVLQAAGPHVRPLPPCPLPDRRHRRRVGRGGAALAGHHQPGRSAVEPASWCWPAASCTRPSCRASPGSRTSRARPSTPAGGTTATPAAAPPSRWTGWPTSVSASSAPAPPPCRWCPRSPGWPRSSTSSSAPRARWASATSSPPTSSGSRASSPAGSRSGSSTSPRR